MLNCLIVKPVSAAITIQQSNNQTIGPDYLLIGHLCHDKTPHGYTLGGAVAYSGLAAKKMGMSPGILTSMGDDFIFHGKFEKENIPLHIIPAEQTTVFENIYTNINRTQYLYARASHISINDLPEKWRQPKIIQCSPICDEVSFDFLYHFPDALIGATIQGWLRQWNENGLVSPKEIDWAKLAAADVVLFSEEDILGFESALPKIISSVNVAVMTQGEKGATVWLKGERHYFPTATTKVVNATGAGDVFAAAFLTNFYQSNSIFEAAQFANKMAGIAVGGRGF